MKVLIQGMRRNGTTVLFDLFRADRRFTCFYEPLAAAAQPCYGGGSGINEEVDYFENVREYRARVLAEGGYGEDPGIFNHGAPRDARLEFTPDCPEPVTAYLRAMLEAGEGGQVAMKFTRAGYKVGYLHRMAPEAHFLHVVRDPRRVVVSYLFGKDARHRERYRDPGVFFARAVGRMGWSGAALSAILLERPEYAGWGELPDYQRLLLLWKDGFERTWREGKACFGERYRLIRHEELTADPGGVLEGMYGAMGLALPGEVVEWAQGHLRRPGPVYAEGDRRWREGYERVGLHQILEEAGYPAQ